MFRWAHMAASASAKHDGGLPHLDALERELEALELRRRAEADRVLEQNKRAERRELERRAALEDIEAQRVLADAKSAAAAERRKEVEASRLARLEEDRRKEKAARVTEDARWLQVTYPLELANRLIAWRRGLPDADVASIKVMTRDDMISVYSRRREHMLAYQEMLQWAIVEVTKTSWTPTAACCREICMTPSVAYAFWHSADGAFRWPPPQLA